LIVLDGELSRSPRGVVHVLQEPNSIPLQQVRRGRGIIRLEAEVEVFALVHKLSCAIALDIRILTSG